MKQLSASDLALLSKLLGLTGSAHDGEALAAARKASALLKAKGATWGEALGLDAMPPEADHVVLARELLGKAFRRLDYERIEAERRRMLN